MFIAKAKLICAVSLVMLAATGMTTKAYVDNRNYEIGDVQDGGSSKTRETIDLVNIPSRCEGILESLGRNMNANNPKAQDLALVNIMNQLLIRQADLSTKLGPEHPDVVTIRSNIEEVKKLVAKRDAASAGKNGAGVRTLRVGDVVEKGEILGSLEDTVARADVRIMESKKKAAEAELKSSEKTRDEAQQRWQTAKHLREANVKAMTPEDVRGAELTYNRYLYEAETKQELINIAISDLEKAKLVLAEHQIRSGVRGIVRKINKRPGEAVRKFDTVITLELLPDND